MRIDSSGNVGIGTLTPGYSGGPNRRYLTLMGSGDQGSLQLANSVGASPNNGNIEWVDVGNTSSTSLRNAFIYSGSTGSAANNRGSFMAFATKDDGVASSGEVRLFIDSAGRVGVGTITPTLRLTVFTSNANNTDGIIIRGGATTSNVCIRPAMSAGSNNGIVQAGDSGIIFDKNAENTGAFVIAPWASGTSGFRMDSSGNVVIGTSTTSGKLRVLQGANQVAFLSEGANTPGYPQFGFSGQTADNGGRGTGMYLPGDSILAWSTSGTERVRISASGGFSVNTTADPGVGAIFATGNITAYYSDRRLKTVSGRITNALDKVDALSGVYYTNNDVANAHGYTSTEVQVGVLAQEVEAVMPEVVKAAPFDLDENGNSKSGENYKTVQYERIVPLLIEAIKELRAEINMLKAQ
jgi:hypothetical protein